MNSASFWGSTRFPRFLAWRFRVVQGLLVRSPSHLLIPLRFPLGAALCRGAGSECHPPRRALRKPALRPQNQAVLHPRQQRDAAVAVASSLCDKIGRAATGAVCGGGFPPSGAPAGFRSLIRFYLKLTAHAATDSRSTPLHTLVVRATRVGVRHERPIRPMAQRASSGRKSCRNRRGAGLDVPTRIKNHNMSRARLTVEYRSRVNDGVRGPQIAWYPAPELRLRRRDTVVILATLLTASK